MGDPSTPIGRLQALIRIPTVSYADRARTDTTAFEEFARQLAESFPLLHAKLDRTVVLDHGLLFHWRGASDARPVVLMAHIDVVPVEESDTWQHPAFGAEIHDGVLWGRGTLDDKGCLAGICEAVESLLGQGFTPAQDVWLSFGCDEEVMGKAAPEAVRILTERGVEPWFVLDEGGAVAYDAFPGVSKPLAVIGVTEKGITNVRLTVEGRGGHASMPTRMDTTARLARAILRLDQSPFPSSVPEPTVEMFRRLAAHLPLPLRPIARNVDRLRPALARALVAAGPESAAMTRTTTVVTTLSGSPANNVIASRATAGINVRIMVGDTVAGVVDRIRTVVNDKRVKVDIVESNEPSPLSPTDDDAFRLLEATIATTFPDAVATPYVMMGATDSRFFTAICPRVYRFAPFRMTKAQRESIHSYDERIGVDDYLEGVGFYRRLVKGIR
ncbi:MULTISPECIES: M20/M25/M40 family metallo-hydrolase [unclassified Nocardioides]|uniref:M20/M25/M40 family metallo-hydrolase n=1 Tax=unclassified Nocardioides TaxID=2615069 RepID=UPI0006F9AEA4|nr:MULTISPECIES: M20/M25/M40 family metallo-hydrolase [unclassified Nocardioides]KQY57090.1 acetylornithine deacetylase [Nocardioides sp. Root140]KRF11730.1 acetylornithine deacetylase [Nocardioides sp. Soil796]